MMRRAPLFLLGCVVVGGVAIACGGQIAPGDGPGPDPTGTPTTTSPSGTTTPTGTATGTAIPTGTPTTTPTTGPTAKPDVPTFCASVLEARRACNDGTTLQQCEQELCVLGVFDPAFVERARVCASTSCSRLESCLENAGFSARPSDAAAAYRLACNQRRRECGRAFPDDVCEGPALYLQDALYSPLTSCLQERCDDVSVCFERTVIPPSCGAPDAPPVVPSDPSDPSPGR